MLKMLNVDDSCCDDDNLINSPKIENLCKNRAKSRHLTKNLSMCNIKNNGNNNVSNVVNGSADNRFSHSKNNILPIFNMNKEEGANDNLNIEKEGKKILGDGNDDKNSGRNPHVVKVFRKKLNPIDIHK